MKTIKQIADEIGVSKQAVRNQIANLGLQSSLRKNGNQFAIDEHQETLILHAFYETSQSENAKQSQSITKTTLRLLEDENTFLKEQITIKDKQIEIKDRQIEELTITIRIQSESINADRKNELAGTLIKGQRKLLDGERPKAWWQFWRHN